MGRRACPPKGIFSHFIIILLISTCYRISLSMKTTHDGCVFVFVVFLWPVGTPPPLPRSKRETKGLPNTKGTPSTVTVRVHHLSYTDAR